MLGLFYSTSCPLCHFLPCNLFVNEQNNLDNKMTVEINRGNTKIKSYKVSCNSTKCWRHLQFVNKGLGFSVGHKPKIVNTMI